MSARTLSVLEQQIMECTVAEKRILLSFIAGLLKTEATSPKKPVRPLGELQGQVWMAEDFDETPECFDGYR